MWVTKCLLIFLWNAAFWGACLGRNLGTKFITTYMQNYGVNGRFEVQVTAYSDGTKVTIVVNCDNCAQKLFQKEIVVNTGQTMIVDLPKSVEIMGSKVFSNSVWIQATKDISVVSLNSKPLSTDIAVLHPVSSLGTEYYIVTPSTGPRDAFPEFSILTEQGSNVVDIYLKGQVVFQGKKYVAGNKLTVTLNAFQGIQLQGAGDLSGTKIVSQKSAAVLTGHVCTWKYTKCNHVFEQLLPVSSWAKTFMLAPLPWQTRSDILFIAASQNTVLKYQSGEVKQTANLKGGEVLQILVLPNSPISLVADMPIQALFYSTGANFRNFAYDTFLIRIPDTESYSLSYTVNGQQGFENFALLLVKASETGGLTVDKKPLINVKWSQIPSTEFVWGLYPLSGAFQSYSVAHPKSPFCLLGLGIANMNSYGTAGASVEIIPKLTCATVLCRTGLECKIINGEPQCVPSAEATCWAWGDPHYHTFDGRNYDFQGTCTYTIAKTCGDNFGLPSFQILAKNENRGNKRVSYVGMVTTVVYGFTITAIRSDVGFVRVNGIRTHLPISLNNGNLRVFQSGTFVIVATDFQLRVSYDWSQHLRVTITSAYYNGVCGLCGNYNGDPGDDFKTPDGTVVANPTALGESWVVAGADRSCWHDCHGECQPCPPDLVKKYQTELYCGLITQVENGPFAPCHSKVNPAIYFENCVYDVCFNEGHKQSLCDALKAYADACQKEGVNIGEWRKIARCGLECPPNSQYQRCGTACPATCADDKTQAPCPAVCVEGCQCKEGFVLSQGKCIPKSSCGCLYEGRPYAPNEGFWADEACGKWCVCNAAKREVVCVDRKCKPTERCQVVNGVRGCYPDGQSTCFASGDPHYISFDKRKFDFQGVCGYVFAEVCRNEEGLEEFSVYVQNENRGNRAVSFTRSVHIEVYSVGITITRAYPGRILVDGLLTFLPYSTAGGRVTAYAKGQDAVISIDFGLTVTFNWDSRATVTVPSSYAGTLCGLCGNFNGNPADDALQPGSLPIPKKPVFGRDPKALAPNCKEIIDPKCPGLAAIEEKQRASGRECGLIVAKEGPFRECHGRVNQEGAFQDCVYDYCYFKGHYAFVCGAIASYARACQAAGVTIYAWRSETFCPPSCPPNSHFELCPKDCPQTCSSLFGPVPCPAKCDEACVCNEGFVRSGDDCVPIGQCGCFYQGRYYPVGKIFYPTCQQSCTCQRGGDVVCKELTCGPNAECKLVDGVQKCFPIGHATCSASGDPHYLSFDGRAFDFQGTCTYILATPNKANLDLIPFVVVVENEAWGNGKVSVTKMVSVEVDGFVLTLLQNKKGLIKVDGVFQRLPVILLGGRLRAYQHGTEARIQTHFGLTVTYNFVYNVKVTVPSNYQGQMGGLCGNYNGEKNDDFQLPDGKVVSDVVVFGSAWKIPITGIPCTDGCSGNSCPVCDEKKKDAFKQRSSCGLLTASDGPFSACHAKVDPSVYLSNCIFDLCMGDGDNQALCQNIQSYVADCQGAGVSIQPWRSPSFCPLPCPANSHYDICTDICKTTCAGISTNLPCPETCAEGCQCDDDFFFDGLKCVPVNECGCFERGKYFPLNEPVLLNDCTERCTCMPTGGLICQSHVCLPDETCVVRDGIMQCYSKDPCKGKICRPKETCKVQEGQPICVPDYVGHCWGWGDPHYGTFDGYKYDFQGTCTYVLVQSKGSSDGLVPFSVEEKNENRGGSTAVSYVREVTVKVYGYRITSIKGEIGKVRVDGVLINLPVSLAGGQVYVSLSGNSILVQANFGLEVSYDWLWRVDVKLPSSYYDNVGGLCGNFNQVESDEKTAPDGTLLPTVAEWAHSWVVEDGDPHCFHECSGQCPTCEDKDLEKYKAEGQCGVISAPAGPFRECHSVVDPKDFLHNCAYDVCMNGGDHEILCQAVSSYAKLCQQEGDWRALIKCPLPCPENSHYEACGNACPATCSDLTAPLACKRPCVETCQCNEGFVLSVDKCVPVESCGCRYNGFYYKPGEEFWEDENCQSHCKCDSSQGTVVCNPDGCKAHEKCEVVSGVRGCHPVSPFTCTSSRDYFYTTFDGQRYEFKGTCLYSLVSVCSANDALTSFSITVQNSPPPEGRAVTLQVYDVSISLVAGQWDKILVDEELESLPFSYEEKVQVTVNENHLTAVVDFGLVLKLSEGNGDVVVSVPRSYAGFLCGLCGNANGDLTDDEAHGDTWEVGCTPGCSPDCPPCTLAELERYQDDKYCGLLRPVSGPLASCHNTIPVSPFFDDCITNTCEARGRLDVWCNVIAAYATACQDKGIPVGEWRTDTFCKGHCRLMPGAQLETFDGLSGKAPAPGTYQLSSHCDADSDDWFRVVVEVASCPPNEKAAVTLLYVFFKEIFIAVNGRREVWVNGLPTQIPSKVTESVTFDVSGNIIILHSAQVQIVLTQDGEVVVTVKSDLAGKVCGACGNFNKKQDDDLKGPGGVDVHNVPELLISWTARDFTRCLS